MVLVEDENKDDYEAGDVELDEIDIAGWEKREGWWVVLEEHRVEVLRQYQDSQIASH